MPAMKTLQVFNRYTNVAGTARSYGIIVLTWQCGVLRKLMFSCLSCFSWTD